MRHYIILSWAVLTITLGGFIHSTFAQDNESANRPGSSANPLVEQPDPNKVIQKERSGQVIPEQVKRPEEECADELNKNGLKDKKLPERKCKNPRLKSQDNNGSAIPVPPVRGGGY